MHTNAMRIKSHLLSSDAENEHSLRFQAIALRLCRLCYSRILFWCRNTSKFVFCLRYLNPFPQNEMENMKYSFDISYIIRNEWCDSIRESFCFDSIFLGANKSDVLAYVGTGATPIFEMVFNFFGRRNESSDIVFRVIKSFRFTKVFVCMCSVQFLFASVASQYKPAHSLTIYVAFCILRSGMCGRVSEWASAWWLIVLIYKRFAKTYVTTANKRESTLQ